MRLSIQQYVDFKPNRIPELVEGLSSLRPTFPTEGQGFDKLSHAEFKCKLNLWSAPLGHVTHRDFHAALRQSLAQQTLDRRIHTAQIARCGALDRCVERGVEAQRKGSSLGHIIGKANLC